MSNSDKAAILDAIRSGMGASIPVAVSSQNEVFDLFEVYIFNLVLYAAQQEGASVAYEDIDNNVPTQLIFRTSPGWIYRKSANTAPFSHAILQFDNAPALEVHLGVYVAGSSQSLHELDVAVVDRAEALDCRRRRISPRYSALQIGTECKFYTSSKIKLGTGRAFFGLTADFSSATLHLVTNIDSESVEFFLNKKNKQTDFGVVPSNQERVNKTVSFLRRAFYQYCRKNPIRRRFGD